MTILAVWAHYTDTSTEFSRFYFTYRNLNTIRSIARLHGDPIDRPTYMAKFAQRCLYSTDGNNFVNHFKWLVRRVRFDYHLLKNRMLFWLIRTYLSALIFIGQPYDELKIMLENPHLMIE